MEIGNYIIAMALNSSRANANSYHVRHKRCWYEQWRTSIAIASTFYQYLMMPRWFSVICRRIQHFAYIWTFHVPEQGDHIHIMSLEPRQQRRAVCSQCYDDTSTPKVNSGELLLRREKAPQQSPPSPAASTRLVVLFAAPSHFLSAVQSCRPTDERAAWDCSALFSLFCSLYFIPYNLPSMSLSHLSYVCAKEPRRLLHLLPFIFVFSLHLQKCQQTARKPNEKL